MKLFRSASRQATKLDLIDIAQALGLSVSYGCTIADLRAAIEARIIDLKERGKL